MMREAVTLPFMTIMVKDIVNLLTHSKCVNVVVEPVRGYSDYITMARSYGVLTPGGSKINVASKT